MKIVTVVGRAGLTIAQYTALSACRGRPLHRVGRVWRGRGVLRPIRSDLVTRLVDKGALEIGADGARLTDRGHALLRMVEGRQ